ncbi:MAG TPA: hemolysin family protein [Patescibacteria group bacterium]|nr:hemolysin family protein [Patescibacteria group bacterium]
MSPLSAVILVVVTLLLAAFFAGSETAVVSCSKVRLRHRAKQGSWRARVLERMLASSEWFFSVVLVGTNISVIVCTAAATTLAVSLFGSSGAVVATIVMTPLILIFAEVIPKSAFLYHADRVSIITAPLLQIMSYVLWPLVWTATVLARSLLRLSGAREQHFNLISSREELIYLYRRGKEEGAAERKERLIIDRIFRFRSVDARELMVPRDRVVFFPVTASVGEVVAEANKHTFSRFPITAAGNEKRVVGVVSLFDLLGLDGGESLETVMQPPPFANQDDSAERLLIMMKEISFHMAIVVDESHEFTGVVTLEDVIENVMGDIANEYEQRG